MTPIATGRLAAPFLAAPLFLIVGLGMSGCAEQGDEPEPVASATLVPAAVEAVVAKHRAALPRRMQDDDVPGLAVALVDRNGPIWIEGFGRLSRESATPVDEHTTFSLQSGSKTFTATATLMAVRDGLVDLDASIVRYLPDFTVNSRFEKRPAERMTLRHLLGHRAGFTHEAPIGNNYVREFESFDAHVASIRDTWLRYPVGQHQAYANLGVDVAGHILGVVSGAGFPQYMRETLLAPLGMNDSSFDWDTIGNRANRATGSWSLVDDLPFEHALIPSGGLYVSASDMGRFLTFQLNEGRIAGRSLVAPVLLRQMREPSFAVRGQDLGYGLGLRRYERDGHHYFNHAGAGYGFKSHMSWYPDLGVGIAVLSNDMDHNVVHDLARDVIADLRGIAVDGPAPNAPAFANLSPAPVDPAAGQRLLGT